MPQMSPMSWMTLMLFFIMMILIMVTLNYFLINYSSPRKIIFKKKQNANMNWKW
uniref:ATP synthase complex subunit 8 n=1 Tax=Dianemobius fascipes TaxID=1581339 RepID=A0A6B9VWU1_9ORTH|nr:ATP synthase F0 subunit 8 [Dianemobius fascipes]QHQ73085.1 ATP synthase F0 subunit 8 [Dianemobius fascipes]